MQLTPTTSTTRCMDASEIRHFISSKGYFGASSSSWSSAVDSQSQCDVVLAALGVLVDHLSRLMVLSISIPPLLSVSFFLTRFILTTDG